MLVTMTKCRSVAIIEKKLQKISIKINQFDTVILKNKINWTCMNTNSGYHVYLDLLILIENSHSSSN